jgi:hypothetical protein
MLKRIVFFLFLALLSNVLWGDEFKVRILSCPKEVVVSAPVAITAEVTNVSGRVITVAYGHGDFTVSLDIRRSDGKPLPPYVGPDAKWSDNFQLETIPVGWQQVKILDAVPLPVESCELVIQVVLASHGPYFHYDKGEKLPVEAWSGEVKSEEAHIQIVEPSGVDKAAYDYFKGSPLSKPQDLLAKFPTSTYAGYALADLYPILPAVGRTAEETVAGLTAADFFKRFPKTYDHENPPPKGPWIPMDKAIKERAELLSNFLAAHPDFVQRDAIEEQLGFLYLALGRFQDAFDSWEWLAKNGGGRAAFAGEMREAIIKQALVPSAKATAKE